MSRPMTVAERISAEVGPVRSRVSGASIGADGFMVAADDIAASAGFYMGGSEERDHLRMLIAALCEWERAGRRVWSLDADSAFALSMTTPPEWNDEAPVAKAIAAQCVYVEVPASLGWLGADCASLGMFLVDDPGRFEDNRGLIVMMVGYSAQGELRGRALFANSITPFGDVAATAKADDQRRSAVVGVNLLTALRHTRVVDLATEAFPRLKSPGKARIEARKGRTRDPITRVRVEVGPPMGTVQERAARDADGVEGGRLVAGHWVRGHWHRFWTGTPEPIDRPDAERPSKHCTLHRVTRWVRPYFTGDAPPVASRVRVGLYRGAG